MKSRCIAPLEGCVFSFRKRAPKQRRVAREEPDPPGIAVRIGLCGIEQSHAVPRGTDGPEHRKEPGSANHVAVNEMKKEIRLKAARTGLAAVNSRRCLKGGHLYIILKRLALSIKR